MYQVSDSPLTERLSARIDSTGPRTLAEKAFEALHDAIIGGSLAPGERLTIEDLANALGMSPMPIREALRRLDAAGLVVNTPHRSSRVAELSIEDLREVYDARLLLEIPAIRGAAEKFTEKNRDEASRLLARHVGALNTNNPAEALRFHTDFHFALYRAAGSRWLIRLISPLWESAERYRVSVLGTKHHLMSRVSEHERMLAACQAHVPEVAAAELWNNLVTTANAVAELMRGDSLYELRPVPRLALSVEP
jgi:DNA-binding GntR family transcriptional regulator